MYTPREVFCVDCKKLFWKKHAKTVRCPECQKAYNKTRQKELYDKKAKERVAEQKKNPLVCTRTKSCKYGGTFANGSCYDYLLITKHKRPCPVQGCTEYKRKSRKKKQEAT